MLRFTESAKFHVRVLILCAIPAFGCLLPPSVSAQKPKARVRLLRDDPSSMLKLGDPVRFQADIQNLTDSTLSGEIEWRVHTVAFETPEPETTRITVDASSDARSKYSLRLSKPGFAEVECRFKIDGDSKLISDRWRVGSAPEQIQVQRTNEDDFDSFWKESIAQLQQIDPEFKLVARREKSIKDESEDGDIDVLEVSMRSFGNVRVSGSLEVPRSPGPHPVVIRVPGYGQNMKPIGRWEDMIVFSFNPRGHGNSQQDVSGEPVDFWIRGLDDRDTYYYRGAYLDCLRAIQFVCQREDVDQDRIAVWGGSQGGGFAFAMAALDSRVDFCVADIPWLCDWPNFFKLTDWPEMNDWIEAKEQRTWTKTLKTLSYFDTMNMSDRIRCPTLMGIGLQDQVCPPATSFAAFNQVTGEKSFRIYQTRGHGLRELHSNWVWNKMRSEFKLPVATQDADKTSE
ncbi:MAG: alpha/beta fold hydrolase [Planctomycetota bacterium]